jgi:hypothetical protein
MMKTQGGSGVTFRVVGFYLGPIVLLILVAGGALSLWLREKGSLATILCAAATVVAAIVAFWLIGSKTENTTSLRKRLEGKDDRGERS